MTFTDEELIRIGKALETQYNAWEPLRAKVMAEIKTRQMAKRAEERMRVISTIAARVPANVCMHDRGSDAALSATAAMLNDSEFRDLCEKYWALKT